jgi:lantibiotic leader peptide-processing serine protease
MRAIAFSRATAYATRRGPSSSRRQATTISTSTTRPASYTNFGQSAIALAAPGGDLAYAGDELCTRTLEPLGSVEFPCWLLDLVLAPTRGDGASVADYDWTFGTSAAAPFVAGVAALVVGRYGPIHPALLRTMLERSSTTRASRATTITTGPGGSTGGGR